MKARIIDKDTKEVVTTFEYVTKVEGDKIFLRYFEETPTEIPAEFYRIEIIK